jgi:hypothetical protein
MRPADLLDELRARGVHVRAVGDRLQVRPCVPPTMRVELAAVKAEIIALLRAASAPFDPTSRPPPPDWVWPPSSVDAWELINLVEAARRHSGPSTSRHAVMAVPEVADGPSHSAGNAQSITITRCRLCLTSGWWRLIDAGNGAPGPWVCATCYAPLLPQTAIERAETIDA